MDDLTLFDTLREDLGQGGRAVLCTVVDSMGSAPRGAGARMALRPDGSALGTIGGGWPWSGPRSCWPGRARPA